MLSIPRIFAFPILKSPGNTAPTLAKTIFCPAATFGAPHITSCDFSPSLTIQNFNLSAFGCFLADSTSPTTIFFKEEKSVTTSDSNPNIVNMSAKSDAE